MPTGTRMSMSEEDPLLLDTHCWIWLQSGQLEKFSQGTVERIRQAGAIGMLRVSIISVWEIALLESKGRVRIHMDCLEWVRRALETVHMNPNADSYGLSGVGPPGTGDARPIAGSPYPRNRRRKHPPSRKHTCRSRRPHPRRHRPQPRRTLDDARPGCGRLRPQASRAHRLRLIQADLISVHILSRSRCVAAGIVAIHCPRASVSADGNNVVLRRNASGSKACAAPLAVAVREVCTMAAATGARSR